MSEVSELEEVLWGMSPGCRLEVLRYDPKTRATSTFGRQVIDAGPQR